MDVLSVHLLHNDVEEHFPLSFIVLIFLRLVVALLLLNFCGEREDNELKISTYNTVPTIFETLSLLAPTWRLFRVWSFLKFSGTIFGCPKEASVFRSFD